MPGFVAGSTRPSTSTSTRAYSSTVNFAAEWSLSAAVTERSSLQRGGTAMVGRDHGEGPDQVSIDRGH